MVPAKFSVEFFVCLVVYLFVDAFAFFVCVGRILFSILEFWGFGFWISKGRWFAEPISVNVLLGVYKEGYESTLILVRGYKGFLKSSLLKCLDWVRELQL